MALNATLPAALEPLATAINSVIDVARLLVGGLFGLYLILLIVKWIEYKRLVKILVQIKKEIAELNNKLTGKKKKKR